jgi:hypothetical protein
MAGPNTTKTVIQLKWSESTSAPTSLNTAEPAYSNTSNKFFIGQSDGTAIAIGGKYYTDIIDAATNANTASTLVKRDASGIFSATAVRASLFGNANTASTWQTARTIGVSGDATGIVSVDGSADANVPLTLAASGVTSGIYGGGGQSVAITIDSKGRITAASNVALGSSTINAAANSGTGSFTTGGTLTLAGATGGGITTTYNDTTDTFAFAVDNTVIRANTAGASQTMDGDLTISGNLSVLGTYTTYNVNNLVVEDSLIALANNNTGDAVDIGFFGHYNDGTNRHTGLMRHAGDKQFYLFDGYNTEPTSNVINVSDSSFTKANLIAGQVSANLVGKFVTVSTVSASSGDLSVGPAGKLTTFKSDGTISPYGALIGGTSSGNQVDVSLVGFGTQIKGTYEGVSIVTSSDGTGSNVSTFNTNGTLTVAGKVTAAGLNLNDSVQGAYNKANAAVFSTSSLTLGQVVLGAGSNNVTTLANASYTLTGSLTTAKTISSLTVDAYGRVTAATGADIAIDTSQLTSGTIADARMPTKGTAGSYGSAAYVPVITTDAYGRVTGVSNTQISIDASQITSGTLGIVRGGTGVSSFTANSVVLSGATATSALVSLNSSTEGHLLQINSAGVPSFGFLNGGSF